MSFITFLIKMAALKVFMLKRSLIVTVAVFVFLVAGAPNPAVAGSVVSDATVIVGAARIRCPEAAASRYAEPIAIICNFQME